MSDGRVVIDSVFDDKPIQNGLKDLEKSMKKTGDEMIKMGKSLSLKVTAPIMGVGTAAVMTTSKFSDSMSKVSAISGATGDDLEKLRNQAKELGSTTAFSASQAADAMGYLALAGWDTNQILAATPDMLNLASAAGMDLASAADIVSDTMSAFGIEANKAGEAADIFAAASSKSNTDVLQLGEAMKYTGAAASAAGMDLAQTSAVLGILADSGLKGSMAGTTLNAMLRDIRKSAEDGAIAIGNTSVAVYDANGNMRDLTSILADVELATQGMTGAQRDAALSNIFQEQAMRGVNIALQTGTDSIRGLETELYNSNGTAKQMAETMEDNLGGALRAMKSALEGVLIQIGEQLTPIIIRATEVISNMAAWFGQLDDRTQQIIIVVGALAAAIGPLLIIFGTMAKSISSIIALKATLTAGMAATTAAATTTAGAATGLGGALAALTGPVGIAIGIIAALTAGIVYLWKTNEDFRDALKKVWENIKQIIQSAINVIKGILNVFIGLFTGDFKRMGEGIQSIWQNMWNILKNVVQGAWNLLSAPFRSLANNITGVFTSLASSAVSWGKDVMTGFRNGINNMKNSIMSTARGIADSVTGTIKSALKIHSPSRVMEDIGEDTGAGFDIGLADKVRDIAKRARDIAGSALPNISPTMAMAGGGTVNHSGTIRIEGVNDQGQFINAVEIVLEGIKNPGVQRAVSRTLYGNSEGRTRGIGGKG